MKLVRSQENRGAGANRNQVMPYVEDGAILHFIDADMDLETLKSLWLRENFSHATPNGESV